MRKIWLIVKREYITRVGTKSFVIGTIALPLFTIGVFAFQIVVAGSQPDETLRLAILDRVGGLGNAVVQRLTKKLPNGQPAFEVIPVPERQGGEQEAELRREVRAGKLDAYLMIAPDALTGGSAEFHTRNPGDFADNGAIERALSDAVIARRLRDHGVRISDVGGVVRGVNLKLIKVTESGESEEKGQSFVLAIILGMLLYTTLIIYGVATMRSVMEEKTTRIVEILVASVRPFSLLAGKIVGVAGVALTQYLIWGVVAGFIALYGAAAASRFRPGATLPHIHFPLIWIVYLALFFLTGYLLYASLYAAIGSMVSSEQEAQQLQMPLTLVIVAALLLFNIIIRNPSSNTSVALSMIPFFAPILMILRIALETPPLWQIALSLATSLATTAVVVYFASRIYRVGVLMYGKRPSVTEIVRWMRYT
jgi:ABC-2 type transport system permease protein